MSVSYNRTSSSSLKLAKTVEGINVGQELGLSLEVGT